MNPESTVGQLVVERPARARVFEKFGIDYCCGGKKPLASACQAKGLDTAEVLSALEAADGASAPAGDWSRATLTELTEHIESTHHAYMKTELPRLDRITERVATVHGARHPELAEVRATFVALKTEMEMHMHKEEGVLFPLCREVEFASAPVTSPCGSIGNPIRMMIKEHESAGEGLATIRRLTADYTPPEGACNTYRAMLSGLAEMEADMHQHVHKENNILFPRALKRESQLAGEVHG